MHKGLDNEILDLERVKYLSNMATDRLLSCDREHLSQRYDELAAIFCFLDDQLTEKFDNLSRAYYNSND